MAFLVLAKNLVRDVVVMLERLLIGLANVVAKSIDYLRCYALELAFALVGDEQGARTSVGIAVFSSQASVMLELR